MGSDEPPFQIKCGRKWTEEIHYEISEREVGITNGYFFGPKASGEEERKYLFYIHIPELKEICRIRHNPKV